MGSGLELERLGLARTGRNLPGMEAGCTLIGLFEVPDAPWSLSPWSP